MRSALFALFVGLSLGSPLRAETFVCALTAIRVFADDAAFGDPPLRVIEGDATGINECYGVALDPIHRELWVAHGAVSVFRSSDAGNVAPLRRITGDQTQILFAAAVAVDTDADEVIVGSTGGRILTFARGANGNATPLRALQGEGAGIGTVTAVVVDRGHGELLVASIGSPPALFALGRLATGAATLLRAPITFSPASPFPVAGMQLDPIQDRVLIVTADPSVRVYDRASASLIRELAGAPTQLVTPYGIALTTRHRLLISNQVAAPDAPDPILIFEDGPLGASAPVSRIDAGAPPQRAAFGIATSQAFACGSGNVVGTCLFRDGFE